MSIIKGKHSSKYGTTILFNDEEITIARGQTWGYRGSGPRELAHTILLAATNDINIAQKLHYKYFEKVTSHFPKDKEWSLSIEEVLEWIKINKDQKIFKGRRHLLNNGTTITIDGVDLQIPSDYPGVGTMHTNDLNYGYNGQGPRELAIAILSHVLDDYDRVEALYKDFGREITQTLPDKWELSEDEVLDWVNDREGVIQLFSAEDNIVKTTCKELGITQKELAEQIGAAEQTVRGWSSGKDLPQWAVKSFEMLIKIHEQNELVETVTKLHKILSKRNK